MSLFCPKENNLRSIRVNRSLFDRLSIIDEQIQQHQIQLDKLLDLYLSGEFPKEILTERKMHLEDMLTNLHKEKDDIAGYIRKATITDDQLAYIEDFCAKIKNGLDQADFHARRQIIELLDVQGKIAFENGEMLIYLKCLIDAGEGGPFSLANMTQTFYLQ